MNLNNFLLALKQKNYQLVQRELSFLTLQTQWPQLEVNYVDTNYSDADWEAGYPSSYQTHIADWNPLAIAACNLDEIAVDLVLKRWSDINLVTRTVNLLKSARGTQTKFAVLEQTPYFNFDKAKLLIFYYAEKNIKHMLWNYSKSDKIDMTNLMSEKINQIKSVDGLIDFYQAHIDKAYISQHRHEYFDNLYTFFIRRPKYPNSKINFIKLIQEQAVILIAQQHKNNVQVAAECKQLLASKIFSIEHEKCGMINQYARDTISYNSTVLSQTEVLGR